MLSEAVMPLIPLSGTMGGSKWGQESRSTYWLALYKVGAIGVGADNGIPSTECK